MGEDGANNLPPLAAPEDAARELPNLSLEDALQLQLYAQCGSPKFEKAALRWLERWLRARRRSSTSRRKP